MRIVLVRHGDPDYEKDCLTELGHRQAEIAAERLMEENIEWIYSSPQGRAKQTAQAFSERSGIPEIRIAEFMREIRYGKIDALYQSGNPWRVSQEMLLKGLDLQSPDWREYPEFVDNTAVTDIDKIAVGTDEWLESLGYRREGLYYRCIREDDTKHTLALFCHGGSTTAFLSRVFNIPFSHLCTMLGHLMHTAITILRFDREPGSLCMPVIEIAADARHLKSLMGDRAENVKMIQ